MVNSNCAVIICLSDHFIIFYTVLPPVIAGLVLLFVLTVMFRVLRDGV
jgi:hypothetical protein